MLDGTDFNLGYEWREDGDPLTKYARTRQHHTVVLTFNK